MMTNLLLDAYAHYNASSLVLVVADLICAGVIIHWALHMMQPKVGIVQLFHVRPMRMLIGAAIGFIGVAWGSIMWLPAFPIMISGNQELSNWYVGFASWPANIANLFSVVGMSIIMWPWLVKKFGEWAAPTVFISTMVVYFIGMVGSLILGGLIREWTM